MSVESEARGDSETVEALGRRLGEAVADLPEYRAFEEAKAAVEADDDLQERIVDFETRRREFSMARQAGDAEREDLVELQRAQQELHARPLMASYLEAKEALQDRLSGVNDAISEPLEIDFGGEAGGCCHD